MTIILDEDILLQDEEILPLLDECVRSGNVIKNGEIIGTWGTFSGGYWANIGGTILTAATKEELRKKIENLCGNDGGGEPSPPPPTPTPPKMGGGCS